MRTTAAEFGTHAACGMRKLRPTSAADHSVPSYSHANLTLHQTARAVERRRLAPSHPSLGCCWRRLPSKTCSHVFNAAQPPAAACPLVIVKQFRRRGRAAQASTRWCMALLVACARGRCPGCRHSGADAAGPRPGPLARTGPPGACRDAWPAADMPGGRVSRFAGAPSGRGRGSDRGDDGVARRAGGAEGFRPHRGRRHRSSPRQGWRSRRGPAPACATATTLACSSGPRQPCSPQPVARN